MTVYQHPTAAVVATCETPRGTNILSPPFPSNYLSPSLPLSLSHHFNDFFRDRDSERYERLGFQFSSQLLLLFLFTPSSSLSSSISASSFTISS
jgi:hypothetical protein